LNGSPGRGQAQDLAVEVGLVLRGAAAGAAVTGPRVQVAVGAEGQPPTVVDHVLGDALEDDLRLAAVVELEPDDPVVVGGGEHRIEPLVLRVVRVDRDPEQATLAGRVDAGHPVDLLRRAPTG
jgi:hypothetical protein